MGLGHVPEEPLRAEGEGPDVQGRQRRGAPSGRPVALTPPRLANRARGQFGEDEAVRWYLAHGYEVVARNWRVDLGEIDVIVARPGLVVFVEVKARADERYGPAAAAVGPEKQRRIRLLAARWLAEHPDRRGAIRFDVVAVTGTRIDVIEAAF